MSSAKNIKIGVVTCSTRSTRVNPYITQYVCDTLKKDLLDGTTLHTIDLEAQSLPLYDEPAIPAGLPKDDPTPHYQREHTRNWSTVYNWSVPASLKNALDFLYHEWTGKAAAVVSYGSRGGGRAAVHLQHILTGLKMKVTGITVPLAISLDDINECIAGGGVLGSVVLERWANEGVAETLRSAFREMCSP
ncbi:hypothetical protein NQ176_g8216 [Zarea fungicola]|uniref:Uncharacterized protein n=1 Tax=Zarea fungicola TaxID=93591 RepID=A0ACC1MVU3_9HYPO|nr:hypothetical protein NQ176_g8216 [Lecanicillium fungicola]